MRTFVGILSLFALASAGSFEQLQGECLVDSTQAVSDALDAAMFMWAAIDRCGKAKEEIKCSVGILSATQSVNSMINVILMSLHKCGALERADYACGIASSEFTKNSAGLGAASAQVVQHCEDTTATVAGTTNTLSNWPQADSAQCIIDVKDSLKDLFEATQSLMKVNDKCQNGGSTEECAADALDIIGSFAGMGSYIAGAVGHCSPANTVAGSVCAQASQQLVDRVMEMAKDATEMSLHCKQASSRLYSLKASYKKGAAGGNSFTNVVLAAFLPVAAVVSFVGGRMYGVRGTHQEVRQCEAYSDVE